MARFGSLTKLALISLSATTAFTGGWAKAQVGQESTQARHEVGNGKGPSAEDVRSALSRATNLLEGGKYSEAAQTLESLSCLRCDARVSLLLAAAFEGGGDLSKARQTLDEAYSFWPSDNSIATALARQYLMIGDACQAAEVLRSSDVSATTSQQEMALRVEVYLAVNRLLDAERVAKIAYQAHPSLESTLMLANVLQMQGRPDDVVSFLQSKHNLYGDSPKFLATLAESQYDSVNYTAARTTLEPALRIDPEFELAYYLLGNTLVKLKEVDAAITEYRAAIRLAPRKPRTHYALALALLLRADEAGAERSLRESLAIDPQYAPAYCELGKLHQKQGHLPEAVEDFNNAIRFNPRYAIAYYHLGEIYRQMGDKSDSEKAFSTFNKLKENEPKEKPPVNDQLP